MVTTNAELYRRSSQYRLWSFTKVDLIERLRAANARVEAAPGTLTWDEEHGLVMFYAAVQAKSLCDVFGLPSQVRASAVSYFRKFYLTYSVMEYQPKLVLATCVFLAAKSENAYIPIKNFVDTLDGVEEQQILDLEFILFKSLDFTLHVHSALRPLHGFFLDMQAVLESYSAPQLAEIHDRAKAVVLDALVSDVVFLFTPTHIALAALMSVNELATTEYMAQAMDGPHASLERLLGIVNDCRALMQQPLPQKDTVKPISKKLNEYYRQRATAEGQAGLAPALDASDSAAGSDRATPGRGTPGHEPEPKRQKVE